MHAYQPYTDNNENENDIVEELFILAQNKCFNISSNAYQTLYHLLINGNKAYVAKYLNHNFYAVFNAINKLIKYDHFVTQKQFFLLLRVLLIEKSNYDILVKYISDKQHLEIIISLMKKYKQNSISLEAYHIFKIFVADPHKQKSINIILWKNKHRLIHFLTNFHNDKAGENEQFAADKNSVIECISKIKLTTIS